MTKDDGFELAFEHGINAVPNELWCVRSSRPFRGQENPIRHTNWFALESSARNHAKWIADGRGTVLSVSKYKLQREEK